MANKAISELPQAQNVNNQDLFVLEQSGIAKKLTAETFITEQGIINALAEALDGHGGIQSVTLSSVSGRIRTYLITFTDGTSTTFQVLDGTSIDRIVKTSTAGLTDTYTVFMSDGTTTFFTVTNGADGTVSEAMLNDALKDKAPAVTETTESSAIANFTDGADDMVMHNIVAEINPVQSGSGDPSPSNIRPITGHTEVNVTRTGKNIASFTNGYTIGTDGLPATYAKRSATTTPILIKSGATYKGICSGTNVFLIYSVLDENNALVRRKTAVTSGSVLDTSGGKYLYVCGYDSADTNTITAEGNGLMVIEGSETDTTYEPYTATTVSLSWQTEAGTVYGGTIDVATGLLTVNNVTVDMGDLTWGKSTGTTNFFFVSLSTVAIGTNNILCSQYKTVPSSNDGAFRSRTDDCIINTFIGGHGIRVKDTSRDSLSENQFKTAMSGVQLVYELATPQTYQLTPQEVKTLLGTNNVWTDIGNVSVTYTADTKLYIEKLTMPTEDDLVANQAITSGKYFMIGNSLYLALANIASGAQITIGTNAQRVSLADALNTINS